MVLSCNETSTCFKIHTRVVDRSMTELQLVGFSPGCQPKNLSAQANSHYWKLGLHQNPSRFYRAEVNFGVPGSIADNYASGIQFEDLVGRKVVRDADDSCPFGEKTAKY